MALSGERRATADLPFSLSARAAGGDFAAAVAALPAGLAPPAGAPRPPGTLDARLDVSGPLATPARWLVDAALDLSNLRALARSLASAELGRAFGLSRVPETMAIRVDDQGALITFALDARELIAGVRMLFFDDMRQLFGA